MHVEVYLCTREVEKALFENMKGECQLKFSFLLLKQILEDSFNNKVPVSCCHVRQSKNCLAFTKLSCLLSRKLSCGNSRIEVSIHVLPGIASLRFNVEAFLLFKFYAASILYSRKLN